MTYFSVTFKAEVVKKNPQLSRVVMILYKSGYNRVPKVLNITGNTADWNPETERFSGNTQENAELNVRLSEIHKKYVKLAEDWENANLEWEPIHWSHYFDNPQNLAVAEQKILTVSQVYDRRIKRHNEDKKMRNGVVQTGEAYAKSFEYHKKFFRKFVKERYGKDINALYFTEIDEQFVKDFAFYIECRAIEAGNKGDMRGKLYRLHAIVEDAEKLHIRGANIQIFRCVDDKFKEGEFDPKTIPYDLFLQIANIDRSLLTKEEQWHIDLYLFCYYCGGMAPIDAAHLRYATINMKLHRMEFQRMKTGRLAKPYFHPVAREIAKKYKDQCYGDYVMPILKEKYMEPKQRKRRVVYIEQQVNKTLKRVAKMIGTKEDIKFYSCRGTYITRMIDLGVHPIIVAEQSGNSPETIYKHYYKNTRFDELEKIVIAGL